MALEFLLIPAAVGAVGLFGDKLSKKMSDKKKIEKIFYNIGLGVKEKGNDKPSFPKFHRKEEMENGTRYVFTLPLGTSSKLVEKIQDDRIFIDGLNKPVEVEFDGMIHIIVYDKHLPKKFPFSTEHLKENTWQVPLGLHYSGMYYHDFDKIPHMTIAGTSRYGKTVQLKNISTSLILQNPQHAELFFIDLKGGIEFNRYRTLEQVGGVADNPYSALDLLLDIQEKMEAEQQRFLHNYWTNVVDTEQKKRTFIIVDEAAQLAPDKSMPKKQRDILASCQLLLSEIARIGGALGYRLIFCTQYPTADTLPRQIKMNADVKISYRLGTGYASGVAIDEYGAEKLPSGLPGRALIKTHETKEIQTPYITDKQMWKLLGRFEKVQVVDMEDDKPENGEDTLELR